MTSLSWSWGVVGYGSRHIDPNELDLSKDEINPIVETPFSMFIMRVVIGLNTVWFSSLLIGILHNSQLVIRVSHKDKLFQTLGVGELLN